MSERHLCISYCDLTDFFPDFVTSGGGWLDQNAKSAGSRNVFIPRIISVCQSLRDCMRRIAFHIISIIKKKSFFMPVLKPKIERPFQGF